MDIGLSVINSFRGEYSFLSNFYPCTIEFDGIRYPTLEHAFQAGKTCDPFWRVKMATADTPSIAKKWGRALSLRPDWESVKIAHMLRLLRQKFGTTDLRAKILATGTATLIEGNTWHDNFWGICTCARCGNQGRNVLGILLAIVRGSTDVARKVRVLNMHHDATTPESVNCMRPGKWGNPFRIGDHYGGRILTREDTIEAHETWLFHSLEGQRLLGDILELWGHDLVCCCKPLDCHCDLYARILNEGYRLAEIHDEATRTILTSLLQGETR